jgi:hypothetical protein
MPKKQSSTEKNVKVLFPTQDQEYTIENYTVDEASSHILSTLYTIQSLESKDISSSQNDVRMLILNTFGYVYDAILNATAYYSDDMTSIIIELTTIVKSLLISISVVIILSIGVMVALFLIIVWHREKTISFFLEIPIRNLRQLYKKCEKYINCQRSEPPSILITKSEIVQAY